ncbi:MAG: hypothetical protein LBI81_02280 [Puniceicoccales bacterium]|nr:hypothetical protein [Puniceicoccales bacterium]
MKTDLKKNTQQLIPSLIRQRVIFFAILCLLTLALTYASVYLLAHLVDRAKSAFALSAEIENWIAKSGAIEMDLRKFLEVSDFEGELNPAEIEAKIEAIASRTHSDYTLVREQEGYLGDFVIYRFGIDFNDISFIELVDVLDKTEAIGQNLAVSEIQISSQGSGLLKTHATISMLNVEK